ncbi:NFACT family protein [bacterium]|nr:NFACT family protein [bacterium]
MNTFDNLTLKAFVKENTDFIKGARIQKVQQPTRRELILVLRKNSDTKKLYININPQFYHLCFMSKENEALREIKIPQKPPMFCMQLRKHLENAKITRINQPAEERIFEIYIETYDELQEKIELCLAVELMGKHSNIILYNADTNVILGCAHNVGADKSSVREVIGGLPYVYPPKQSKKYTPESIDSDRNINDIIDDFFAAKISENNLKSLRLELINFVQKQIQGLNKQCKLIEKIFENDKNYEEYKHLGDLIMANLYSLKDYSSKITVFDYETNAEREIVTDENLTLKENAQNYYKKYTKIKKRTEKNTEILENYRQKLNYYEDILYFIKNATGINDLNEIKQELQPDTKSKTEKTTTITEIEINGYKVFIGKNNKQNDYIVSKLAKDEDFWFHVQNATGSHILLKCSKPDDKMIFECAKLAKEFSSVKDSSKAGVIYTKAKYLKKPPKSPLGYVTYKNEQEIVIGR